MAAKEVPPGSGFLWSIRARCDWEAEFCVDVFEHHLDTFDIVEVATWAVRNIETGGYTIFGLERIS